MNRSSSSTARPDPDAGQLVELIALGFSAVEAADHLDLPLHQVQEQLTSLRRAHGTTSTAEAVRLARAHPSAL